MKKDSLIPEEKIRKTDSVSSHQNIKKSTKFTKKPPITEIKSKINIPKKIPKSQKNSYKEESKVSSLSNRPEDLNTEVSEFTSNKDNNRILVPLLDNNDSICDNSKEESCFLENESLNAGEKTQSLDQNFNDETSLNLELDFVKKNESFFDKKMRRIEEDYKDLMQELKEQYRFEVAGLRSKIKKMKEKEDERENLLKILLEKLKKLIKKMKSLKMIMKL